MKTAYITLIKNALAKGLTVSVWDGEEWQVKRSSGYQVIKEAIESVEVAELRLRDQEGKVAGWAMIIPFGVEPDETVADYTASPLMEELVEGATV